MSVFPDGYCFPEGFQVDANYFADDPFQSRTEISTFNADKKTADLTTYL
jgi:hypothetical protein